jgi:uncharacterized protein (TIGR02996 family)
VRRFERDDDFWEIELDGRTVVTRSGRVGSKGTFDSDRFLFAGRARAAYDELVAERKAAGFEESAPIPTKLEAREPTLEAAIRANRRDDGAYEVYADWLQQHGNPLGELIGLQRALAEQDDAKQRARVQRLLAVLRLPDDELAELHWRWGFWRVLKLENRTAKEPVDPVAFARGVFAHPACTALEELRIGSLRLDVDRDRADTPALIVEAGRAPWAADLVSLVLGDVSPDIDMAHHCVGDVGPAISSAFPRLERLLVHSGDRDGEPGFALGLAGLALPQLTQLTIETCSLSRRHLVKILGAYLPKLTELELWFGSPAYGADVAIPDLEPLLAGRAFPHLTSLALCNAEFEDQLARVIHEAPIAAQLTHLELSMGTLDDGGAAVLAQHAASFPRLTALEVHENFLTQTGIQALRAAFPNVELNADRQREGNDRYVAVAE